MNNRRLWGGKAPPWSHMMVLSAAEPLKAQEPSVLRQGLHVDGEGGTEVQNECRPCLVKCSLSGAFCRGKESSLTTEQVAIWLQAPHGMSFSCQLCTWWALPASELTSQIIQIFSCWAGPLGRWIIFNLAHHGMREGKKTTKGPEFWNFHDSLVFVGAARRWSWEH